MESVCVSQVRWTGRLQLRHGSHRRSRAAPLWSSSRSSSNLTDRTAQDLTLITITQTFRMTPTLTGCGNQVGGRFKLHSTPSSDVMNDTFLYSHCQSPHDFTSHLHKVQLISILYSPTRYTLASVSVSGNTLKKIFTDFCAALLYQFSVKEFFKGFVILFTSLTCQLSDISVSL